MNKKKVPSANSSSPNCTSCRKNACISVTLRGFGKFVGCLFLAAARRTETHEIFVLCETAIYSFTGIYFQLNLDIIQTYQYWLMLDITNELNYEKVRFNGETADTFYNLISQNDVKKKSVKRKIWSTLKYTYQPSTHVSSLVEDPCYNWQTLRSDYTRRKPVQLPLNNLAIIWSEIKCQNF